MSYLVNELPIGRLWPMDIIGIVPIFFHGMNTNPIYFQRLHKWTNHSL